MKKSEVAATIKKLAACRVARGFPSTPTHEPEAVYDVAEEI
jgi:hypothetical protein